MITLSELSSICTTETRQRLYDGEHFIQKAFINPTEIDQLRNIITYKKLLKSIRYFDAVNNKKVRITTPTYWYGDYETRNYTICFNSWSANPEIITDLIFRVQILRNLFEEKPFYTGFEPEAEWRPQLRMCLSHNTQESVRKHRDFTEDNRVDPTGPHTYRPEALQATLSITDYGKDYSGVGFYLCEKSGIERSVRIKAGDLIIWPYNAWHGVKSVFSTEEQFGFGRIIFPSFHRDNLDA